jgi:type IV secretion system protein VirB10
VVYKGAQIVGAEAGPALDRSLVLMPGIIRCVLDTAIDSTLPGPLLCHMPSPVISDGGVVLMDKGTQVIGQYTSDVKQGQGRLMAVTATAYTPNGIPVPLGGPFADDLGRSGLEGNVDTHLFQRFGGAVLLSLADSAFSLAQASVSKGGNSYVSLNSGGGVGSLAQEVLRNTINMPPTITKNAGDTISLWILAPIDFSKAYHLKEAR